MGFIHLRVFLYLKFFLNTRPNEKQRNLVNMLVD